MVSTYSFFECTKGSVAAAAVTTGAAFCALPDALFSSVKGFELRFEEESIGANDCACAVLYRGKGVDRSVAEVFRDAKGLKYRV